VNPKSLRWQNLIQTGAGESGKSTLLKQMKLIHEGGYSREERKSFKPVIFNNTIQSMRAILEAMTSLNIAFDDQRALNHAQVIANYERTNNDDLLPSVGRAISVLWRDPGVQQCFQRSREYQLNDSAK
jgi:guanine nucleotide-binding protein subunit alpha